MGLELYNTLHRAREAFVPADPGRVTMYVCGPTVYSYAHIGNARPPVVFDVLARLLRRSYRLVYVRNITDVDDKINTAAREAGVPIGELTAKYAAIFHADMAALGVRDPDVEPRVTAHIPAIVGFIERLVAAGNAYVAEGHVLFAVESFDAYGRLSGRARDEMIAGARVEVAPYKRDPGDFVLWKPSAPDDVGWDSPWGYGRPGWHIECSAMVEAHLGPTIDIHGGGQDLVFPHHENEIAQSTCAHRGAPMARYWVHNGLVHVGSEKMSKSLGNVLLVHELLEQHAGEVVRLGLLNAHYRQPLDWSEQLLADAKRKLDRMYGALRDAGATGATGATGASGAAPTVEPAPGVVAALEDDLNTPKAIAELFELVRATNRATDPDERRALAATLRASASLIGLLEQDPAEWFAGLAAGGEAVAGGRLDASEIDALLDRREALRRERKFAEADAIRDELAARGIVIEDGAGGSRWRRA
jgi:cysteinyl-tRNA synthetase